MSKFLALAQAPDPVDDALVPFGEWLPDMPEQDNAGAVEALNVLPGEGGYVPLPSLALTAALLPVAAKVATRFFTKGGSAVLYAGTADGVYERQAGAMVQVFTATPTLYGDFIWNFVQFGDFIVSLYPEVAPQVGNVGGGLPLTPLGGSPPTAACGGRIGDFLFLGDLGDVDGSQPQRVRWSGFDNIEAPWISDPATQADFQDMPAEGGRVVAVTGREFGSIFQERCISRVSYVGLPTVFDIETVEVVRGAISLGSVVDLGSVVLFIAEDGFFVWNGVNSTAIADNKINRYFRERLDWKKRNRIVSAVDHANKCIAWAFPVIGESGSLCEVIFFSYKENHFSHAILDLECLVGGTQFGVSLDELTGDLDTDYPTSFDDSAYSDGRSVLSAFDMSHTLGLFNGPNMAATLETGESTGPKARRVFINGVKPIVDVSAPACLVSVGCRDQFEGEAIVYTAPESQEITGVCPVMADARYVRFKLDIPYGITWKHARGVQPFRKAAGLV